MVETNRKFEEFAHQLIAESLLKWSAKSQFVSDKLVQKLKNPVDPLDKKIADYLKEKDENFNKKINMKTSQPTSPKENS